VGGGVLRLLEDLNVDGWGVGNVRPVWRVRSTASSQSSYSGLGLVSMSCIQDRSGSMTALKGTYLLN
jgi:hypothetical protein